MVYMRKQSNWNTLSRFLLHHLQHEVEGMQKDLWDTSAVVAVYTHFLSLKIRMSFIHCTNEQSSAHLQTKGIHNWFDNLQPDVATNLVPLIEC